MHPASIAYLLPDLPRWVEVRGMLLADQAVVFGLALEPSLSLVARHAATGLVSVVGSPPAECIRRAIPHRGEGVTVLAAPEDRLWVAAALPGWTGERAALHVLVDLECVQSQDTSSVRLLDPSEITACSTLPPSLCRELLTQVKAGSAIAGACPDGQPVSFCYPGSITEQWWDISIDTLDLYRRQGHAARCVAFQIARMLALGKRPVWGSVESNQASTGLAAKLGFRQVDEIVVFSPGPREEGAGVVISGP